MGIVQEHVSFKKFFEEQVTFPKMFWVHQKFDGSHIEREDIGKLLAKAMDDRKLGERVKPGMSIALTAGSRGVANIDEIIRQMVIYLKKLGAEPFVIPAMGSHGGATAEGQREIIESYNVREEFIGCPIKATMDTVLIGKTDDGRDVYIDKYAAAADGIIPIGRVKYHTAFSGPIESGIMKMLAIGVAKQYGAAVCHAEGFRKMAENVPRFGQAIIDNSNVLFGIGIVENAFDETCALYAVPAEKILEEEPGILKYAASRFPKLYCGSCETLIVDKIGKNYSGGGMDPNITGKYVTPYVDRHPFEAEKVAILDISDESHGNGIGTGFADAMTDRLYSKLVQSAGVPNAITSTVLANGRIPFHFINDYEAIGVCMRTINENDKKNPRVVRIANTMAVSYIQLSEAYWEWAKNCPDVEIVTEPEPMKFDADGNLTDLGWEKPEGI